MSYSSLPTIADIVPTINGTPVLLPAHSDDFDRPGRHYHVDYRYTNDDPIQGRVVWTELEPTFLPLTKVRPDYQIRMDGINLPLLMARRYQGHKASCSRCPHQGLPVMRGQCVGHGMMFTPDGDVVPESDFLICAGRTSLSAALGKKEYVFVFEKKDVVDRIELRIVLGKRLVSYVPLQSPIFIDAPFPRRLTVTLG